MKTSHETLPEFVAFIGGFIVSASNTIDLGRTIEHFRIICRQEIALRTTSQPMNPFLALLTALLLAPFAALAADRPKVLVILADDLVASDLGCFGTTHYETPNIDRLASRGLRLIGWFRSEAANTQSKAINTLALEWYNLSYLGRFTSQAARSSRELEALQISV